MRLLFSQTPTKLPFRCLWPFRYKVDYPNSTQAPTYTVCVVGAKRDTLYTFASRVPAPVWERSAETLREAAGSFALL